MKYFVYYFWMLNMGLRILYIVQAKKKKKLFSLFEFNLAQIIYIYLRNN